MPLMVVTLDVSQLETSASKSCKPLKSQLMSETPETSQSATGPYVAMADAGSQWRHAGSTLTAWTAVFRASLFVKV
eukprot:scaffold31881_cov63-Phaeocystis_antarctica.AAC.2